MCRLRLFPDELDWTFMAEGGEGEQASSTLTGFTTPTYSYSHSTQRDEYMLTSTSSVDYTHEVVSVAQWCVWIAVVVAWGCGCVVCSGG